MSLSKVILLLPVLIVALGRAPAVAQMSSSNIDPSYQAVMSRAGGESYVRQEPVESGSGGYECYDYSYSYSDYRYGFGYGYSSAASSDAGENPGEEEWRRWNPSRKRDYQRRQEQQRRQEYLKGLNKVSKPTR